jgi:Flp pilus assembly protein TadD
MSHCFVPLLRAGGCWLVCWAVILALVVSCGRSPTPSQGDRREAAHRASNRGVAMLEQHAYLPAVDAFREALALDPELEAAAINLPIALFYAGQREEAAARATAATERYLDAPQPPYLLGLIARAENRADDAMEAFRRVLDLDPDDVGALVHLALVYMQERGYEQAVTLSESALALEPYNATAAYNLAQALTRLDREAGIKALERFQELNTAAYSVTYSQVYLEQGRYAEAVASTGAEAGLVSLDPPDVVFTDATSTWIAGTTPQGVGSMPMPLSGGVTLADLDGSGYLDVVSTGQQLRVFRNTGSTLIDVTGDVGLAMVTGATFGAVVGDVDNDLRPDLLLLTDAGPRLFTQGEDGRFREGDLMGAAGIRPEMARAAALVDVDHDGDLDVVIGGLTVPTTPSEGWEFLRSGSAAPSWLLRNNGDGTFTDITSAAGLAGVTSIAAIVPTDFDNRRDVDLLLLPHGDRPRLFRNLRTGDFLDVGADVGLPDAHAYTAVAVGDVNKDGFPDFFFGMESAPGIWALSNGRGGFDLEDGPPASRNAIAVQLFDYDNDGLLDLFVITPQGPHLFRNMGFAAGSTGPGRRPSWQDQTSNAFPPAMWQNLSATGSVVGVALGDLDLDGDTDIALQLDTGELRVWRNDGGNRNRSLRVTLQGRVSNRSGAGAKVEVRAGSLYQRVETASATPLPAPSDIVFGLGSREAADVVRVLWPAGILQAETELLASTRAGVRIEELDRKPSSCPYLFTWNGTEFEFVTDFLGGGETGYWLGPGLRNDPDPIEYVRITDDQLRPRDGRFEIRVTNELEEALYLDRVRLLAVTHPADVTVFPDEGLRGVRRPFQLFLAREARPLDAAFDDGGRNLLPQLSEIDRRYADTFELLPFRGYAREHTLTMVVPHVDRRDHDERVVLLLTGWTDYAFSRDNVGAHQAGLSLSPPALQVKDSGGRWQTVDADIGIPVGRPQTLVVDVTDVLPHDREVRLLTNMRIYWDRILAAAATVQTNPAMLDVPRLEATLRWRGFSAEVSPDGRAPLRYDYSRVEQESPWKLMPGRYTREGEVGELLDAIDDRFVISRPGDELVLAFDARELAPPAPGYRRTFLLHTVGYSKEMDMHSASPDTAAPIPFSGMSRYPYSWPERYPHADDLERFHTRVVPRSIAPL